MTNGAVAWVFPGQGSQVVGMGRDLCARSAAARAVFDKADRLLGFPLSQVCFEGPEAELRRTDHAQPAIFTASLAALEAAREAGDARVAVEPAFSCTTAFTSSPITLCGTPTTAASITSGKSNSTFSTSTQ